MTNELPAALGPSPKIYLISRVTLATIFLYHGLVPKILFRSEQEIAMNEILLPFMSESFALVSTGVGEILFAGLMLLLYRNRFFNWVCIVFGTVATLALLLVMPELFADAFNPFSINLAVVSLAVINLLARNKTPDRRPSD